jgi:hypothetical protein
MRVKEFPLRDLNKIAYRALAEALGPAGFIRFMQQREGGKGDYTKARRKLLGGVTAEEFEADLRRVRQEIQRDPALRRKVVRKPVGRKAGKGNER